LVETRAYRPTRNIFAGLRAWPKTSPDFMFERARFLGISARRLALAAVDPFRPGKAHGNARPRAAS
jgi:hypothetical protein